MYVRCPKCAHNREKKGTKTLSILEIAHDKFRVKCFHASSCEWNEGAIITSAELGEDVFIPQEQEESNIGTIGRETDQTIPFFVSAKIFPYYDREGCLIAFIRRYDNPSGKIVIPMGWNVETHSWVKGWPKMKLLYNTDLLLKDPDADVVIVEGEKAAEAGQQIMNKKNRRTIFVTWPLGAANTKKGDWELIQGRKIKLWPDADETGRKAMIEIAGILEKNAPIKCSQYGATSV